MAYNLMIIESPNKIEKLSAILGPGWKIAASVGHIRDLPKRAAADDQLVAGIRTDYSPVYELTERGEQVVSRLKTLVQNAAAIYLATDPDREGESISWHLQQCLKLRGALRVAFNAITESAVNAALSAPRTIDIDLVASQEARRVLDRLYGYLVSPELTRQLGENSSAGRVQSVAVAIVVERERQIRQFQRTMHWGVRLRFAHAKTGEWSADWITAPDFTNDRQPYVLDRDIAARVAATEHAIVIDVKEGTTRRSPPAPFITSTMQRAASVVLDFDPKKTMELAQSLFSQGHITYHRTDNPNISDEAFPEIAAVAAKRGLPMSEKIRRFKTKDGAQAGHPATTPTHWAVEQAGTNDDERALYQLIRIRAIASQLADAQYAVRKITLQGQTLERGFAPTFQASGRTLERAGWLQLLAKDQTQDEQHDNEDSEQVNPIPKLDVGTRLNVAESLVLEKATKAPARYTLPSLIEFLEEEGIGRPSTYAAIMDNIVNRGFVVVDKKFLKPTPIGERIVDALVGNFQFVDLRFTREMEADLDRIAAGDTKFREVVQRFHTQLERELSSQRSTVATKFPCPGCGKPLRRVQGSKGAFWGCTGHPECSVTLPDEAGKPGQRKSLQLSDHACRKCGKPLIHRTKSGAGGYDLWVCSGLVKGCKTTYPSSGGKPNFG